MAMKPADNIDESSAPLIEHLKELRTRLIWSALAFLVAEENTHITGQVIFADGGAEATHRGATTF